MDKSLEQPGAYIAGDRSRSPKAHAQAIRLCFPSSYSVQESHEFAEREYPVLTSKGWSIRSLVRVPCNCKCGHVHASLEAPV